MDAQLFRGHLQSFAAHLTENGLKPTDGKVQVCTYVGWCLGIVENGQSSLHVA
jgi:hypothetical protein